MLGALPAQAQADWRQFFEDVQKAAPGAAGGAPSRKNLRVVRVFSDKPVFLIDEFAILPDPTTPESSDRAFIQSLDVRAFCAPGQRGEANPRCISIHRDHLQNRNVIALMIAARTIILRKESRTGGLSLVTLTENLVSEGRRSRRASLDLSARQDKAPTLGAGQAYAVFPGSDSPEIIVVDDQLKAEQAPSWKFTYPDLQWQFERAREVAKDYDWTDRDPCAGLGETERNACLRKREPRGLAGLPGGSWLALSYRIGDLSARSVGQPGGDGGRGVNHREEITCGLPAPGYSCSLEPACAADPTPPYPGQPPCPGTGPGQDPVPGGDNVCICQNPSCSAAPLPCAAAYSTKINAVAASPVPAQLSSATCPNLACQMSPLAVGAQGGQAGPGGRPGRLFVHTVASASACDGSFFTPSKLTDPTKADGLDRECLDGDTDDCEKPFCQNNKNVQVCPEKKNSLWEDWYKGIQNSLDLWDLIVPDAPGVDSTQIPVDLLDVSTAATKLVRVKDGFLFIEPGKPKQKGKKQPSEALPEVTYLMALPWAPNPVELPRAFWDPEALDPSVSLPEDPTSQAMDAEGTSAAGVDPSRMPRCRCEGNECSGRCRPLSRLFMDRYKELIARSGFAKAAQQLRAAALERGSSPDLPVELSILLPFSGKPKNGTPPIEIILSIDGLASLLDWPDVWAPGKKPGNFEVLCNDSLSVSLVAYAGQPGQVSLAGQSAPSKKCPSWLPQRQEVCYRPLSGGCPKGPIQPWPRPGHPDDSLYSCAIDCAADLRYPDAYDVSPSCPPGYTLGKLSDIDRSYVGNDGRRLLCPGYASNPGDSMLCSAPAGKPGVAAPSPIEEIKAKVRTWSRTSWAVAIDKLHPLELRRRAGQGNAHFKQDELVDAKTRYLSTRAHLNQIETQAAPGCTLDKLAECSVCKNGPDKAPDDWKALCALGAEVDQRAGRLFRDENYYGYERNFVPPVALRTFSDGTAVSLADVVRDELNHAREDADKWLSLGRSLGHLHNENQNAISQLNLQRSSLAPTYAPGGSLSQEIAAADARISDAITLLQALQTQIKSLEAEKQKVLINAQPTFALQLMEVAKIAAVAAASGGAGVVGLLAATYVWEKADSGSPLEEILEGAIKKSEDENATAWLSSKKDQCISCLGEDTFTVRADDSRVSWSPVLGALFTSDNAKKTYEVFAGTPNVQANIEAAVLDSTARQIAVQAARLGLDLATAGRERRILQQKVSEAQIQVARIDAALQAVHQALGPSVTNKHPAIAVQEQIVEAALNRAADRVDRAGEYFFLLRRGVERETVPGDPLTGLSKLSAYEDQEMLTLQECVEAGVHSSSIHITFRGIPCFETRTEKLRQYAQLYWGTGGSEKVYFLDMADTIVPRVQPPGSTSPHSWTTDAEGNHTIQLDLTLAIAHRDIRSTHKAQKLDNIRIFLETDDPVPAVLPLQVQRGSLDAYWIGTRSNPTTGQPEDVFQFFDVAKGAGSSQLGLLDLARVPENYVFDGAVCNGLTEGNPLDGPFEACSLRQGDTPAFLARQSLLGRVTLTLTKAALAGRTPQALRAHITYRYVK